MPAVEEAIHETLWTKHIGRASPRLEARRIPLIVACADPTTRARAYQTRDCMQPMWLTGRCMPILGNFSKEFLCDEDTARACPSLEW